MSIRDAISIVGARSRAATGKGEAGHPDLGIAEVH
jgi:hypothetical protein